MIVTAFDTETTDLIRSMLMPLDKQPYMTEFYACRFDLETGEITDELDTLIKVPVPLTEKVTKITGITDEMLKDAPQLEEVGEKILTFLRDSERVFAHNAKFDKGIVDIAMMRLQRSLPWPKITCTVEQTMGIKGRRLTMTKLHEYLFGEPFEGAHRAKVDVAALKRCIVELNKRQML